MKQEDRDQIVAQLRKEAQERRDTVIALEEANPNNSFIYPLTIQANTFSKIASIFESLRTE